MLYKAILAVLAVTCLSACQDFLEPESISTFDTNYVFSNVDDARKGVNAIYEPFGEDAFRSRLSNNMTGNTDIERQSGWTSSSDRYQIWDLEALSSNNDLRRVWNAAYQAIRDANIAIDGIENSPALASEDALTTRTMNHLLGEAYTLRAYWYSILAFYWGDVPYVREAPKAGNDFFLEKTDRNFILSEVIQDMIDIEGRMLWAEDLPYGIEQVNREYTLGMIARLSLQRGGYYLKPDLTQAREADYLDYYQIAKKYTEKLMALKDRPLPEDFRQVFLNNAKFISPVNSDILFEVPFAIGNGDVGWNIGVTVQGGATASHDYGSGNNYMAMPPSYFYSFDTADIRRDVTCALYMINTDGEIEFARGGISNIAQGKWSRWDLDSPPGASSAKGTGINWPMLRYSDVILMHAEAENELNGPTALAQESLKRVRRRAFDEADWGEKVDAYVADVSAGKETFFEAIVNERAWEFGGEMIRKYELIRWGNYSEKMAETVTTLKKMADSAMEGSGQYAELPDYIYWKVDESGNFVVLNPDTEVAAPPDDTWNREPWLIALNDEVTVYDEWILKDWRNYIDEGPKPGTVRYIFPVPEEAITNSQGTLSNDGYAF
ncbi:RagB/SusD family nutrient uptake outer membrane protein [Neolewinella litorea]|uniref:RagB/SusD family nutrient uptake outer membrane protein n=1 Tax=Neolewinella litorea TaxID=2562452 RepID=A0A4S4NP60_9BACT|nr:RagB/SusD family nutrient uptake outer membrane protein [Neolewinella litorea]THH41814.1 RagB/SusD family nutrient uptake outer membrane protein [Neolewinella litorea]